MNQLERTLTSLEIAEMVGRPHDNVLKDIRRIITHLGDDVTFNGISNYFIESTYTDGANRQKPCFNLTKKGCELYGTRMTGEKGTQFAVKYIERFNEMEQQQKVNFTMPGADDPITLALESTLETRKLALNLQGTVEEMKEDVKELQNNLCITSAQAKALRSKVNEKVHEALGGKGTNAYKHLRSKTYSACWREFWNCFNINEYRELPRVKFEKAMEFLLNWRPNTELHLEIRHYNTQLQLELVH